MKKDVPVEHDKAVDEMFPGQPERVKTARLSKTRIDDERSGLLVKPAYSFGFKAENDHDVVYLQITQCCYLSSQQCLTPNLEKAFRFQVHTVEACSFAGRKYDCFHVLTYVACP